MNSRPQISLPFSVAPASPADESLNNFHPIVQEWFAARIGQPTAPQKQGWPLIQAGEDVLIAAPTGSGKTLAAFLACLDDLFRRAVEGRLPDQTRVVYVSPLKALGNDVQKNLLQPLKEIFERARARGLDPQSIRVQVRTGDTKASERAGMVKKPPHILITTPESFYLYLTASRSSATLHSVKTVIVDEIHALARDKRGSHFALSMERLKVRASGRLQLVGLSATIKPLEAIAAFLIGDGEGRTCRVAQVGHLRPWEISVETPDQELSAVATHEMWGQIYDRMVELSQTHRTLLVFANTRRLAERVAHDLGERIGHERVAAHHGSMARELRLAAEERLKSGSLRVMVATASLELGIDIGSVDLVCQLGSPRSIAVALQRVGRAGHQVTGISKGILFAMTQDELVECTALLRSIREGELDAIQIPVKPLDILAQQVVAACVSQDWDERNLFALFTRANPYRTLTWNEFEQVLNVLSEGVATGRGRRGAQLHRDRVNGKLRARPGARIAALTGGGAIPDTFNYPVIAEPEEKVVGTLDEDFAVESMAGDIFLLGSTAWRIQRISAGTVRVEDAKGQAPTVPFWRGEAPSRTVELSQQVGRMREELVARSDARTYLEGELGLASAVAQFLVHYLQAGAAALGAVPSSTTVIAERFFDEAGGMQLLLHAPFGGRINRAWGLALRKRFCRAFNFELQAAASDDGILLSLGERHSFPLADVFDFLSPDSVEEVLTQAVLQTPLFGTRFRWNATRALALLRYSHGKRVPPHLQRARSDDLLAAVFPAQVACQDNATTPEIELPDHPLVKETVDNCLREAMDLDGLKEVLEGIQTGRIRTLAVDLPEPSVFAHQLLNSQPYTYLDDAPLEERRARAVSIRRALPPQDATAFGALDATAISQVVADAQPLMRNAEEVHDALLQLILVPEDFEPEWVPELTSQGRVAILQAADRRWLVATERLPYSHALFPDGVLEPPISLLPGDKPLDRESAVNGWVRGWMEVIGPTTVPELATRLGLSESDVQGAMVRLEADGQVLRGRFRPAAPDSAPGQVEWCDRRLLQRIHQLTVGRLRREIEPLSPRDFMRFLFRWHHLGTKGELRGSGGLLKVVGLLQGYEAPAAAWEQVLFPARMKHYLPELLEQVCWHGEVAWGRLTRRESSTGSGPRRGAESRIHPKFQAQNGREHPALGRRRAVPGRNASITFVRREQLEWLLCAARPDEVSSDASGLLPDLSETAKQMVDLLKRRGASFFTDLVAGSHRIPSEVEDALWELVARGLVTSDAVDNLRVLQSPRQRRRRRALRRGGPGRWTLMLPTEAHPTAEVHERVARLFLDRYGIVCRDLAIREPLSPSWRELLYIYRRLEARGEIRGGRFLSGMAGEQFALPEAVEVARAVRRQPPTSERVELSAVDPLNLTGVITPGLRVPAVIGNVVTYVDGVPLLEDATSFPASIGEAQTLPAQ